MSRYRTLTASGNLVANPLVDPASDARVVESLPAIMVNGNTVFTIRGGPILIEELFSECITANSGTASTMQWSSTPNVGSAATITAASASLASATAGTTVRVAPTALSTAPTLVAASAGGLSLGTNVANRIIVKDGTLTLVIGVGSTTGTWKHRMRFKPLAPNVTVTAS